MNPPTEPPSDPARTAAEQCPQCREKMALVCDPTGVHSYLHCFHCSDTAALRRELDKVQFDLDSHKKGGVVIGELLNKERDANKALRREVEEANESIVRQFGELKKALQQIVELKIENSRLSTIANDQCDKTLMAANLQGATASLAAVTEERDALLIENGTVRRHRTEMHDSLSFVEGQRDTALARAEALRQLVWNPDEGENDRFERIGEMYHADTGFLRPGKSDPLNDSNSQENRDRFTLWLRNKHLAAIDAATKGENHE